MPNEEGLHVSFSITEEDLFRFYVYHFLHRSRRRWAVVGLCLLAFGIITYLLSDWGMRWGVIAGLIAMVGYVFLIRWVFRWKARHAKTALLGLIGEHRVEIKSEGVHHSTAATEGIRRWDGVHQIVSAPNAIYFYMGTSFAFLVPWKAFASREQGETFLQAAQQWHSEAKALQG